MRSLRTRCATVELVFHDGDTGHPLTEALAWLAPVRSVGVAPRPGYQRAQRTAVLHRYGYDRAKAIAQRLFVSESAVSKHVGTIFHKLGLDEGAGLDRRVSAALTYLSSNPATE